MQENSKRTELDLESRQIIRRKAIGLTYRKGFLAREADDLTQEITLRVLTRLDGFDPRRGRLPAFVQRVAGRCAASLARERHARKRGAGLAASLSLPVSSGDGTGPTALAGVVSEVEGRNHTGRYARAAEDQADLRADVQALVDRLPRGLRRLAVLLRAGSTPSEAARALGVPRTSLYATKARLRRACEGAGLARYLGALRQVARRACRGQGERPFPADVR